MLVWKGWGLMALGIPVICSLLTGFIVNYHFGEGFYKASSWPMPVAFLVSAIPVFILGYKLNNKPGRIVVDIETNEQIELKTIHSFFWIPMQYWGIIIVCISIWMYLSNIGMIY